MERKALLESYGAEIMAVLSDWFAEAGHFPFGDTQIADDEFNLVEGDGFQILATLCDHFGKRLK